jgi:Ser/Thr protein kinase RdoA (MazF antagonist)
MVANRQLAESIATHRHLLGDELATAAPAISELAAAALLNKHYGLTVTCRFIWGEKDAIFITEGRNARHLVKFINSGEPVRISEMHTNVLRHLEQAAPDVPVQRVVLSQEGRGLTGVVDQAGNPCLCRVVTLIPGVQQESITRTLVQKHRIGALLADMQEALKAFTDVVEDHALTWDVKHVLRLRPLVQYVPGDHRRLHRILDEFAEIHPALLALPAQATHNDFNPANIIVGSEDHDRIAGVIDFGDMVANPTIVDLAVACAHQIDGGETVPGLFEHLRGYLSRRRLSEREMLLLPVLMRARMFMRVVITECQALLFRDSASTYTKNVAEVWRHFAALDRLPDTAFHDKLSALAG